MDNIIEFDNAREAKEELAKRGLYTSGDLYKLFNMMPRYKAPIREVHYISREKGQELEFYSIIDCIPRLEKRQTVFDCEEDLCRALIAVNYQTKKQDKKQKMTTIYKLRVDIQQQKNELYWLKDKALNKMAETGVLTYKGYHTKERGFKTDILDYYVHEPTGFSFHSVVYHDSKGEYLGKLNRNHKPKIKEGVNNSIMNIKKAKMILEHYIKGEKFLKNGKK